MALIHTINAFAWPLLTLAVLLGMWKLLMTVHTRRTARRSNAHGDHAATAGVVPLAPIPRGPGEISNV
ncbi:hypothetical protein [Nesterenkonia natronophila]|nr:hypothetical protein [Nesterenkonia natronophila]